MDLALSMMENSMLRKMSIILAVIALGMTAIETDAFARGGGGGGGGHGGGGGGGHGGGFGGGGHMGGGFGGGHMGGGFAGGRIGGGFGGGRIGGAQAGIARGGFATRSSGLHVRGDRGFRRGRGFGGDLGWGWYCDEYQPYYNGYCY
jgi:hypothetical protein